MHKKLQGSETEHLSAVSENSEGGRKGAQHGYYVL